MGVYDRSRPSGSDGVSIISQKEVPLYGSSRIGLQKFSDRTFGGGTSDSTVPGLLIGSTRGQKYYEQSNHLGNILATVTDLKVGLDTSDDGIVNSYEAQVASATDYYPFGWEMPGRKYNSSEYRYGFNGKEKDQDGEFGSQLHLDYGFRIYDPTTGRFLSVDPLSPDYPQLTPYQFAANSPIAGADVDGLEFLLKTGAPSGWSVALLRPSTNARPARALRPSSRLFGNVNSSLPNPHFNSKNPSSLTPAYLPAKEVKWSGGETFLAPEGVSGYELSKEDDLTKYVRTSMQEHMMVEVEIFELDNSIKRHGGRWSQLTKRQQLAVRGRMARGTGSLEDQQLFKQFLDGQADVHGNSRLSDKVQEVYEIYDVDTNETVYIGLGGRDERPGESLGKARNHDDMQGRNLDVRTLATAENRDAGLDAEDYYINEHVREYGNKPELQGELHSTQREN